MYINNERRKQVIISKKEKTFDQSNDLSRQYIVQYEIHLSEANIQLFN